MGSGTSLHRSRKCSYDYESGSRGVIKRIPIEVKPRGRLGLGSVSSFGRKSKGGSLRNALSFDLEHPDVDKVKREYEMYKMQKESEIANLEKKEQKLEMENKRMRTELQTLQQRVSKLRAERDAAKDAERQALARSQTFENERDKVQRQFKIFRETKENEIQNLLKTKRDLEQRAAKGHLGQLDESESASKAALNDTSIGNVGDWWLGLESEPSLGSTTQLHHVTHGDQVEVESPVSHISKELLSPNHALPGASEVQANTLRIYFSIPPDLHHEMTILFEQYIPKLRQMCVSQGRYLITVHFNQTDVEEGSDLVSEAIARQVQRAAIFVAFLGTSVTRFTPVEYRVAHISVPGDKPSIFAFRDVEGQYCPCSVQCEEATLIRAKVAKAGGCRIIPYTATMKVTAEVYTALERLVRIELGLPLRCEDDQTTTMTPISAPIEDTTWSDTSDDFTTLCSGSVWDSLGFNGQVEAFHNNVEGSCELELEQYYDRLAAHVSAAGPLPPLLVLGADGSGRSFLLAKWIRLQQQRAISGQILFHFVLDEASCSADPTTMIRRLTAKLLQCLPSAPPVTGDPSRLAEEFPRWLEKVSSRTPGGVILVLDSIDRCQFADKYLKWLLDPLPVDVRVIISAHEDTCLTAWRSWPTIHLRPLSSAGVLELVRTQLSGHGLSLSDSDQSRILSQCRTPDMCSPLYAMVLSSHLASGDTTERSNRLETLLSCPDCPVLYKVVMDDICLQCENAKTKGLVKMILQYLYVSRDGLSEDDLFALMPRITWSDLAPALDALHDRRILTHLGGVYAFDHQQAREAVEEKYFDEDENPSKMDSLRRDVVLYLSKYLRPGETTCRVVDELLWQLRQLCEKERLRDCLRNMCIFIRLYGRGRYAELLGYWAYTGADKPTMARELFDTAKKYEQMIGEFGGLLTLPRIADLCEAIGRFLLDLGQFAQAVAPLQHALEIRETALDPDHPKVAQALHQLATLNAQWNKLTTAETLYKQALDIYEGALGGEHALVAKELESLAMLYRRQNKHELSDPLYQRAVNIRRHLQPSIAATIAPRTSLQKRMLQLEELAHGTESPHLAKMLHELGTLNHLQKDFVTAERLLDRVVKLREHIEGADHLSVAESLSALAAVLHDQNKLDQAAELYKRALDIRLVHKESDLSAINAVIKQLGSIYKRQEHYEEAESLYRLAVEIRAAALGDEHTSVATSLVNLAVILCQQKKHQEALPLYERAVRIYDEQLGERHPRVLETLKNIALVRYEMGELELAATIYLYATGTRAGYGTSMDTSLKSTILANLNTESDLNNIRA